MELCRLLTQREERLDTLDAGELLERMEQMEREGATFLDRQTQDTRRRRYIAPVVIACVTVLLMAGLMALMIWGFAADAADAPPLPLIVVLVALPATVILGVLLALVQRVQEIGKGEVDDARKY